MLILGYQINYGQQIDSQILEKHGISINTPIDSFYLDTVASDSFYQSNPYDTTFLLSNEYQKVSEISNSDTSRKTFAIKNISVVKYKNDASALLELENKTLDGQYILQLKDITENAIIYEKLISQTDSIIMVFNLPLNKVLHIELSNIQLDSTSNIGEIRTIIDDTKKDRIMVDEPLFNLIGSYQVDEKINQSQNLLEYLFNETSVPYLTKLEFVQNYLLYGKPFNLLNNYKDITNGFIIPNSNNIVQILETEIHNTGARPITCNCNVISTPSIGSQLDGIINYSNGRISPSFFIMSTSTPRYIFAHSGVYDGAGKFESLNLFHTNGHSDEIIFRSFPNLMSPIHFSRISYTMLCMNGNLFPSSSCNCTQDITFNYKYDSHLITNIHSPGSGIGNYLRGGYGGYSEAEDWVILAKSDYLYNVEVLDANRVQLEQEYSLNYNYAFYKTIYESAAALLLAVNGATAVSSIVATQALRDALTAILGGFSHSYGYRGIQEVNQNLLNNNKMITIESNKPIFITLLSFSEMHTRGWGKVDVSSSINSTYLLDSYIPCIDAEKCSSNGAASWITSYRNNDNKGLVGNFYSPTVFNYTGIDAGGARFKCDGTLISNKLPIFNENGTSYNVSIYNNLGQKLVMLQYFHNPNLSELNSNLSSYAKGIYYIHILDSNNKSKQLKLVNY